MWITISLLSLWCLLFHSCNQKGKPVPFVMWYRDDLPMATEAFIDTLDRRIIRHEITVGPLSRKDLNSRLTCKAINHPRAPPLESTVLVDMNCKSFSLTPYTLYFYYSMYTIYTTFNTTRAGSIQLPAMYKKI